MDPPGGPEPVTYWQPPAPDDQPTRSSGSVLNVRIVLGIGIGLLWTIGFLVAFVNAYGDCFDTEAVCQQVWVAASQRFLGMLGLAISLTVSALLMFVWVGPRSAALLLILSVAATTVAIADMLLGSYTLPYVPGGLILVIPAFLCFIVASASVLAAVGRRRVQGSP
jgi:hypothetical protein